MNGGIMNETWVWYYDICGKRNNIESKSKHIISKHINTKKNMALLLKNIFLLI